MGICRATRFSTPVTPKHAFLWSTFIVEASRKSKAEEKKKIRERTHLRSTRIERIWLSARSRKTAFEIGASLVNCHLVTRSNRESRFIPLSSSYYIFVSSFEQVWNCEEYNSSRIVSRAWLVILWIRTITKTRSITLRIRTKFRSDRLVRYPVSYS